MRLWYWQSNRYQLLLHVTRSISVLLIFCLHILYDSSLDNTILMENILFSIWFQTKLICFASNLALFLVEFHIG